LTKTREFSAADGKSSRIWRATVVGVLMGLHMLELIVAVLDKIDVHLNPYCYLRPCSGACGDAGRQLGTKGGGGIGCPSVAGIT
jgi:hypothetical protein